MSTGKICRAPNHGAALQLALGLAAALFAFFVTPTSFAAAPSVDDSNAIFSYAEATYPQFFSPSGAVSQTVGNYYYRYYSGTKAYLATANDGRFYYLGPESNNQILDLGTVSDWVSVSRNSPQTTGFNDTGQTRCYDSSGVSISCTVAPVADDGRYGRDAAATAGTLTKVGGGAAGFDFTKIANNGSALPPHAASGNGPTDWACTRDNVTGLTWEVKTLGRGGLRSHWNRYTWFNTNAAENGGNPGSPRVLNYSSCDDTLPQCNTQAYIGTVNAIALCGFTDWRLPTPRGLRGIVNYGAGLAGVFETTYFTPAARVNAHYFTGSTYAADPAEVWLVEIGGEADGGGGGHNHLKGEEQHIILVRGAQPDSPRATCAAANPKANLPESTPSADFLNNGNGTVTHLPTGLMWKRCAEGLSGESCTGHSLGPGHADSRTWNNALAAAESSTFAGFTDWRLPNLKELHSIVETCGYDLAINQSVFPGTPFIAGGALFWSSTTSVAQPDTAWFAVFGRGGAIPDRKTGRFYVRLVRGGHSFGAFDSQNAR